MVPAGPGDVLHQIDDWQRKQFVSRYTKVAKGIKSGIARIQRFSSSIDMLAPGSTSPACLLWGSIKFVLTVGDVSLFLPQALQNVSYEPVCLWHLCSIQLCKNLDIECSLFRRL